MALLKDTKWKRKYSAHKHDLVDAFYLEALSCSRFYDRVTGYFQARALTLVARGLEELVRADGRMRLLVGCTLGPEEVAAIERGEAIAAVVETRLALPLKTPTQFAHDSLELLAWMVGKGLLEIKVGIPCDEKRKPIAFGIVHEKGGVLEDKTGDAISFIGSVNETEAGWKDNRETIRVTTSWEHPEAVRDDKEDFALLWNNEEPRTLVMDVPTAARDRLLEFLPKDDDAPRRLKKDVSPAPHKYVLKPPPDEGMDVHDTERELVPPVLLPDERRRLVWGFVEHAPSRAEGERIGVATANVEPWPHQERAFERMYRAWPTKLLIADEVGLGKTIQAGMLLRQAWLSKRAKRILVLAPKAVLRQWQLELREKFNLSWPIYSGHSLVWLPTPAAPPEREVSRTEWHQEPFVLASSHLMRRRDRVGELLSDAKPWDLIVLDEAHHARAGSDGSPNQLLRLMRALKAKTSSLLLLTATPMQVAPTEVWDLLDLLGLPPQWSAGAFIDYFDKAAAPNPTPEILVSLARLFQATEAAYGPVSLEDAMRLAPALPRFGVERILRRLREGSLAGMRVLPTADRAGMLRVLRTQTPVRRLISRNTRELLRKYFKEGRLKTRIADRVVIDEQIELISEERALYEAVEHYISNTYAQAPDAEKSAVGFVMTIYRRRLSSSFHALRTTLQKRLLAVRGNAAAVVDEDDEDEDLPEEAAPAELSREAVRCEEVAELELLLRELEKLGTDSKTRFLQETLKTLRKNGNRQVMVFTQYTDTMDYLRGQLDMPVMCFSGRGGEVRTASGDWRRISRDETKKRFRAGEADVLLCTDAAAEGLNFQFCGALVNYDMPWNPMRVEQRIGRIDRLGQLHEQVRIVNLHYSDTVETDVYLALRSRIGLFERFVGKLQPILARLSSRIADVALAGQSREEREKLVAEIAGDVAGAGQQSFDLDEAADAEINETPVAPAPYGLAELDVLVQRRALLPPGCAAKPLATGEYEWSQPGMTHGLRVTTSRAFYEANSESVELWSQGSPLFPLPEPIASTEELAAVSTLAELLKP